MLEATIYNHIENLSNNGKWALEAADLEELGSVYERELTNLASDHIPFVQQELIRLGKKLIRKYNVQQIRGVPYFENVAQKINNHLIKQNILLGPYAEGTKILSRDDDSDEKLSIEKRAGQVIEVNQHLENRLEEDLKRIIDASTRVEAKKELELLFECGIDATRFLALVKTRFEEPQKIRNFFDFHDDATKIDSAAVDLELTDLLHKLVSLNREEHFGAIVPLVCFNIGRSYFSNALAIQTLIQLMKKMPKDERLVDAAKKALNLSVEEVRIELYDCLLKYDESINDVIQHIEPPQCPIIRPRFWEEYLKLLAKNGKALDFVKTKMQTLLAFEAINIEKAEEGADLAILTYLSAVGTKILGVDLLVIFLEKGFAYGEERKILDGLKIWAEQALNDLRVYGELDLGSQNSRWGWDKEKKEPYDAQMKESLNKFDQALLASEQRSRFKRA